VGQGGNADDGEVGNNGDSKGGLGGNWTCGDFLSYSMRSVGGHSTRKEVCWGNGRGSSSWDGDGGLKVSNFLKGVVHWTVVEGFEGFGPVTAAF
jgi:hypothetical protein